MEIGSLISELKTPSEPLTFIIEDVCHTNAVYRGRYNGKPLAVQRKMGVSVGRVQQSQIELMRLLEFFEVKYKLIKPCTNWGATKYKKEFELATGWTGNSNPEKRAAAYYGYLGR